MIDWLKKVKSNIILSFALYSLINSSITKTTLLHEHIHADLVNGKISLWKALLLYNQHFIFPICISLYLMLLLIEQTQLRNLHINSLYLAINQNFILLLVVVSGIITSQEDEVLQKTYTMTTKSVWLFYLYIVLCLFLSGLAIYIIYNQTIELGIIWLIISILSGILVGLVGIMLLYEEN